MSTKKKSDAREFLETLIARSVTIGMYLEALRMGDDLSQADFAKKLKISRSHLNDIEKGRKSVSPERAVRFARALRLSEHQFVKLALQSALDKAGLKFTVSLVAA